MKVSQSLLKEYDKYIAGETCGIYFEEKYINKTIQEDSTRPQNKGNYFEYLCTGATNRQGLIPEPEIAKTGKTKGELLKEYKFVEEQANLYHDVLKELNGEILDKDIYLEYDNKYNGTLDSLVKINQETIIQDLKFTAHINNKWDYFGWVNIEDKPNIIQAKHYIWLYFKIYNVILPFEFWIFSNKDAKYKRIRVEMSLSSLEKWETYLKSQYDKISKDILQGFTAIPSYDRCQNCPLNIKCKYKTLINEPIEQYYF